MNIDILNKENEFYYQLSRLKPQIALEAQKIIDDWDDDYEGGKCDEIAQMIGNVILQHFDVEIESYGHDGDDHAAVIVSDGQETYLVDIPAHIYETGGGYNWQKVPNVKITSDHISIAPIEWPI